jgi:hypothetical protein
MSDQQPKQIKPKYKPKYKKPKQVPKPETKQEYERRGGAKRTAFTRRTKTNRIIKDGRYR